MNVTTPLLSPWRLGIQQYSVKLESETTRALGLPG
jgi:hypothetical protein